jgi:hypothetical protein
MQKAEAGHAAVIASMTALYPQSRFALLDGYRARWLWEGLHKMPRVTALIGEPDPREGARGGGQQQMGGAHGASPSGMTTSFSEQQNEILFRALVRAKEEFLFMNIATPISRRDLAGMLESLANLTSPIASRQQGATSIGFGVSLPIILNAGVAQAAQQSYGEARGQGVSEGIGVARGAAHTEGVADSSGWSYTKGVAHTEGQAVTDSVSHSSGVTRTHAVSSGASEGFGASHTDSVGHTVGNAYTSGSFSSSSAGGSHSESQGGSRTETDTPLMMNVGGRLGGPEIAGINIGFSDNISGPAVSDGSSWGVSDGSSWASTSGSSSSATHSEATTVGSADSTSHSVGVSQGVSDAVSYSESNSVGHAVSRSEAVSNSEAWGVSGSHTKSSADTVSESESRSLGRSYTEGVSLGRSLGVAQMQGMGMGVAPSASISKSFQWKDEAAVAITQLLEQRMNTLKEAGEEGGFYSDVYILTRTENGRQVAEAASVSAFGGSQGVVTHLQPRRPASEDERKHILRHARAFTPSTLAESLGWINGYAYSTIITPTQQAAYSAPGLFEEGTALTIQERIPPFAFMPNMKGEVVLGFLHSTERGELTAARVLLSKDRHAHTMFAADTRYGKSVAAERMAVEVVDEWQHRVVVPDFGAGWRRLLNGPLPNDRVDIYQLFPGAWRPLRWNFIQIGRRIDPNRQYAATAELIANAGQMGPRQLGYIKQAMWELYVENGVMTADKAVYTDPKWGVVAPDEESVLQEAAAQRSLPARARAGAQMLDLEPFERQALAVHRSKKVSVVELYGRLKDKFDALKPSEQTERTSLKGVLLRLEIFSHGEMGMMYGASERSIAIEDLGLLGKEPNLADRYGLCILEGGAEMDEYAKAVIFGLAAWHLYNDSVVRRRETIGGFNRPLNIFFEEANKVLKGVNSDASGDGGTTTSIASSLGESMWRDGIKYGIYLHPITQTPSELPEGIVNSCNNAIFGQLKGLKDRDIAMGHLARSERGFADEEYKRFLSRMPKALMVCKLGYSEDIAEIEPMLMRPLRVPGSEPTDTDIMARFGSFGIRSGSDQR